MTKFGKALRKKYPTPWDACVALGLDPELLRADVVVGDDAAILKGESTMPKLDHKNRAKRSTEDLDRAEAQEALQRWADENLDPEQVDQLGDLVAAAYGGYDDDDDNEDGAMTDAYMRRRKGGRDSEKFNLSDRDEDGLPANGRRRGGAGDMPPPFPGRPTPGGRLVGAKDRALAADRIIAHRDRGREILARMNPNVLRIRTGF